MFFPHDKMIDPALPMSGGLYPPKRQSAVSVLVKMSVICKGRQNVRQLPLFEVAGSNPASYREKNSPNHQLNGYDAMQPKLRKPHIIQRSVFMGITWVSIGFLLLLSGCSELVESKRKQNKMITAKQQSVSKTDRIYRLPPIDSVAPVKTETATFALG